MTNPTIRTQVHAYNFDISQPDQARAYEQLSARLKATQGRGGKMVSLSSGEGHYWFIQQRLGLDAEVDLETAHLFSDQWNTAPAEGQASGLRVFDWAEDYSDARCGGSAAPLNVRRGHYLDITPEMIAVREDTLKCGYCGAQHRREEGKTFCDKCLDSPYLKEGDLNLLRLLPAARSFGADRPALTSEEKAGLVPLYIERQTTGATSRNAAKLARQRADTIEKADKAIADAKTEKEGKLWLLDHGFSLDNVIFYTHTGRFSFGWRDDGLEDAVVDRLLEVLSEFPGPYDIVTRKGGRFDGRKLSGN